MALMCTKKGSRAITGKVRNAGRQGRIVNMSTGTRLARVAA